MPVSFAHKVVCAHDGPYRHRTGARPRPPPPAGGYRRRSRQRSAVADRTAGGNGYDGSAGRQGEVSVRPDGIAVMSARRKAKVPPELPLHIPRIRRRADFLGEVQRSWYAAARPASRRGESRTVTGVPTSDLDPAIAARLRRSATGLVAAIVQERATGQVLMLAWMDDEALHRTLTTGRATYWSRSRQRYWVKGETSGHHQYVREVALDCDGDALLIVVDQVGPACHTGSHTCFTNRIPVATAQTTAQTSAHTTAQTVGSEDARTGEDGRPEAGRR
jgi:phosphoribosyl-AMP cyclohydrolase